MPHMQHEDPLPCAQERANGSYPKSDESSPHFHTVSQKNNFRE